MLVPALALRDADSLPAGTKPYASALRNAEADSVLALGPQDDHLQVSHQCPVPRCERRFRFAAGFRKYHGYSSQMDRARACSAPIQADLSGVLVAGTFRREDRRMFGRVAHPARLRGRNGERIVLGLTAPGPSPAPHCWPRPRWSQSPDKLPA